MTTRQRVKVLCEALGLDTASSDMVHRDAIAAAMLAAVGAERNACIKWFKEHDAGEGPEDMERARQLDDPLC